MSSTGPHTLHRPTADDSPWDEVRRVCRRVAILHAHGHHEEAETLESTELDGALARAHALGELVDEERLFAEEAERVSAACLLAELIAPLVADRLRTDLGAPRSTPLSPAPARALSPARPAPTPAVPDIADLIDGMLAQQRPRSPS